MSTLSTLPAVCGEQSEGSADVCDENVFALIIVSFCKVFACLNFSCPLSIDTDGDLDAILGVVDVAVVAVVVVVVALQMLLFPKIA